MTAPPLFARMSRAFRPTAGRPAPASPDGGSFDREQPYRPAFRNLRELAGEEAIQRRLHTARVAAPSGLDREVLLPVEQERRWRCEDAGVGREFPQQLARGCVE